MYVSSHQIAWIYYTLDTLALDHNDYYIKNDKARVQTTRNIITTETVGTKRTQQHLKRACDIHNVNVDDANHANDAYT